MKTAKQIEQEIEELKGTRVSKYFSKPLKDHKLKQLDSQLKETKLNAIAEADREKLALFNSFATGCFVSNSQGDKLGKVVARHSESFSVEVQWEPCTEYQLSHPLTFLEFHHFSCLQLVETSLTKYIWRSGKLVRLFDGKECDRLGLIANEFHFGKRAESKYLRELYNKNFVKVFRIGDRIRYGEIRMKIDSFSSNSYGLKDLRCSDSQRKYHINENILARVVTESPSGKLN